MREGAPGVQVQVVVDGHSFAPPPVHVPGRRGLDNVQARVEALGAQVDWAPQPGGGTVFTLWLPLQGRVAQAEVIFPSGSELGLSISPSPSGRGLG